MTMTLVSKKQSVFDSTFLHSCHTACSCDSCVLSSRWRCPGFAHEQVPHSQSMYGVT